MAVNDADGLIPAQGGHEDGCPQAPLAPEPSAVVVSISAVPMGKGHLRAFPFQSEPTLTSVLNWTNENAVSNTSIVQTCVDCGLDISIYVRGDAGAHIVIDVVGYFSEPEPTPPQINVLTNPQTINPNQEILVYSPRCPSGYQLTSGAFHGPRATHHGSRPAVHGTTDSAIGVNVADSWLCEGRNDTTDPINVDCYSVCSRLPGS